MSRVTYWVEYTFKYKYYDSVDKEWYEDEDFDARRFHCPKKEIKNEVRNAVMEELELQGDKFKDVIIQITDYYLTTDEEV